MSDELGWIESWRCLPRVGADAGDGLQLEALILAVKSKVPQLQLGLIREVGIDSSGPGAGDQERLRRVRGPGEGRRPRDLAKANHDCENHSVPGTVLGGRGGVAKEKVYQSRQLRRGLKLALAEYKETKTWRVRPSFCCVKEMQPSLAERVAVGCWICTLASVLEYLMMPDCNPHPSSSSPQNAGSTSPGPCTQHPAPKVASRASSRAPLWFSQW